MKFFTIFDTLHSQHFYNECTTTKHALPQYRSICKLWAARPSPPGFDSSLISPSGAGSIGAPDNTRFHLYPLETPTQGNSLRFARKRYTCGASQSLMSKEVDRISSAAGQRLIRAVLSPTSLAGKTRRTWQAKRLRRGSDGRIPGWPWRMP